MKSKSIGKYDVAICGGGPAGCAAALSASRSGLRVIIIENMGQLGGMATSGLVSHWLGGRSFDCRKWVVGGIFKEMSEEAESAGIAIIPKPRKGEKYQPHGWHMGLKHGIPFDPFMMAAYLDRKMIDAGVDVLFFARAVGVVTEGNKIKKLLIADKRGIETLEAKAFVDATGDADIAFFSGCKTVKGREEDGLMTPATLMMHVDNVDQDVLSEYIHKKDAPRFREEIKELRKKGIWKFPYEIFISVQLDEKGVMMINTSRLCDIDGTDPVSISEGMVRGRRESLHLLKIMRKHFPGFANARLKAIAPLIGIRETRRIVGIEKMTINDIISSHAYPSTIGFTSYGWDLPDPKKPSHQPMDSKKVVKPQFLPIPYGIMVPKPVTNLICPGRAVSVERDLLGPLRVMTPCMAMGEAAGIAALQVVKHEKSFRNVDTNWLRRDLRKRKAIVDIGDIA
ncbi:MAG TPA: hypothetical protein DCZ94_17060 [Lentisphaeria bacterium]|nr:MAG: hypothetical protein A2X48_21120 [Lentisphaerae bacterium GWF2_49_21]HBC88657.1 hypothetical protein [Lentisphaeria bacterium]